MFKTCSDQNFVLMATWDKTCRSQHSIPYPFDVQLFLLLLQNSWIGYKYLIKILGLGINIGPNFWDWVVAEILAAHIPYEFMMKYLPRVPGDLIQVS